MIKYLQTDRYIDIIRKMLTEVPRDNELLKKEVSKLETIVNIQKSKKIANNTRLSGIACMEYTEETYKQVTNVLQLSRPIVEHARYLSAK